MRDGFKSTDFWAVYFNTEPFSLYLCAAVCSLCLPWLPLLSWWDQQRLPSWLGLLPFQLIQLLGTAEQMSLQYYHNPHPSLSSHSAACFVLLFGSCFCCVIHAHYQLFCSTPLLRFIQVSTSCIQH